MAKSWLEVILIDYRWVFVCTFLLPASFFYNLYSNVRNKVIFRLKSAPHKHAIKVANVQQQIVEWNKLGRKGKMCTSRPGWQTISFRRPLYKDKYHKIDCSLIDILHIDVEKKCVVVEPLVSMGQLSNTLLDLGWSIPIVPELDDLTVGGLVMGTGIESSSHIFGLFQHICLSYELILADGSLMKCSKHENTDLFYAIPWSYGTLGFLTAVEIQLIPAKKYVKLTYEPVTGLQNVVRHLQNHAENKDLNDFVEGILFEKDRGVIMTGKMVDGCPIDKINEIGKWYKPWFFMHVKNIRGIKTEYIPLRDYYHRHSRSIFWELQDIIPFGNNKIFRFLLGWLMPIKISLLKLTTTETIKRLYENNHIIQDLLVPIDTLSMCIEEFEKSVNVYPIWLCPFVLFNQPGFLQSLSDNLNPLYVDIGLYGVPKVADYHPIETTRKIEDITSKVNGFQMLYADTYLTKEEFREMFDHKLYDRLRLKYNCTDAFPEVYDKINRSVRY